jgi:hypothetical protein
MAERIIYCLDPVQEAKNWVKYGNQNRSWTFSRWTVGSTQYSLMCSKTHPLTPQTAIAYPDKKTGLSGTIAGNHPFTVRYDWDSKHKFHVNAMLGNERRLYKVTSQIEEFDTELQAIQRYDTLTERIDRLGDEEAARWFME